MAKMKLKSRTQRWTDACSDAQRCVEELMEMQTEFQDWRDNIPENLETSPVVEKLEAICEMDFDDIHSVLCDAESLDLPLGFGRD